MNSTAPHADFRSDASFRPRDWRFQLSELLAAGPLPPHLAHFADATVRAAAAASTGNTADNAITAAQAIANGSPLDAAEVEGRVISGQTDAEIGVAIKLPTETVAAYVALFFDVRHLLDCRSRLRSIAAGGIDTFTPTRQDTIRWAGFRFGGMRVGLVADYYRLGFDDGRRITGTAGLEAAECKDFRWVRNWLSAVGPIKNPAAVLYRSLAYRKKDLHERRRAAAGRRTA
jgi:hypothetical protein